MTAGRAVGEDEAHRQQAGGRPEQGALGHDAGGHGVGGDDGGGRQDGAHEADEEVRALHGNTSGSPVGSSPSSQRVPTSSQVPGLPLNGDTASGSHQISRRSETGV